MLQVGFRDQFCFAFESDWTSRVKNFLKYGARDKMKPGVKLKSLGVYMVHFEGRCYWIDYNFLPEISGNMLWI